MAMVRTQVYFPEDLLMKVKIFALKENKTVSQVLREIAMNKIREYKRMKIQAQKK